MNYIIALMVLALFLVIYGLCFDGRTNNKRGFIISLSGILIFVVIGAYCIYKLLTI
jgi:hypothetical protein